jgi:hypothetical protein
MSEQRALDNRCVDCRYFDPRDSEEQPPNPGYCVRFPPVLARAGEDPAWRSAWSFPVVMGGEPTGAASSTLSRKPRRSLASKERRLPHEP